MPDYSTLSRAERRTAIEAIAAGAPRVATVRVLDLDHQLQAEIVDDFTGGQVDVSRVRRSEAGELTTRVFNGQFIDQARAMSWDADSPSKLALWPSRMMQVIEGHEIDGLGEVTHKTFTGPVVGYARRGAVVRPTCYGKEFLAQRELGETRRFAEGTRIVRVMRELLEMTGETRFDLPDLRADLPNRLVVAATANVWQVIQRVARGGDVQAYYPGNGRFTVRRLPGNPSILWDTGEGGLVIGEPEVSFRLPDGFGNEWIVTGRRRGGGKNRRARGRWRPNPADPLSPRELMRGDVPGVWRERRRNPKLATDAACERVAERRARDSLRMATNAIFDAIPGVPFDEGDLHAVAVEDAGRVKFRVNQFSIPYGDAASQSPMTVNRLRRQRLAPR